MIAPSLLRPFVRTRTRLILSLCLVLALIAAPLPWWLAGDEPRTMAAPVVPAPIAPRDEPAAMAEALRTGKEVLVETATSATALTWALPSGLFRTRIHAIPQRARNATGQWSPIDITLARTGDSPGGLDVRPKNPPVPVRFSGGGATTGGTPTESVLAEVELDGHTVAYTWPGVLPKPVLDGPRALYPEVLPGVDLLMVARDEGGFGQLLIVKNRATATIDAVRSVTYGLRSATAVFRHDPTTGGVRVLDPTSGGHEIGSIPAPFAWDSAGRDPGSPEASTRTSVATSADVLRLSGLSGNEPGAHQAAMPTRLDGTGTGTGRLHLDVAATGLLTDADVRFPIFLDPTLISGTQAWATVYAQHPNTNTYNGTNFNSGTTEIRVGYEERTPLRTRSFWRMGFSSSLRGAAVSSATFKVLNHYSFSCTARELQLWLTGAISSGTTWSRQPSWTREQQRRTFAHGYNSSCAGDYVSFNVSNAAGQATANGWSSITLGMRATNESDTDTWRKFRVGTAELTVDYNRPPREPTSGTTSPGGACVPGPGAGATVGRTNLVLAATGSDPDNNLSGLRFRFWKDGSAVPAGTLVTSLSSGRGSVTIPSTTLEHAASYSWDVRAEDAAGAVSSYFPPGDAPCRITVDATAPSIPEISSDVFREATPDGATWATVRFGETGAITFSATDARKFSYSFDGVGSTEVPATAGAATVPALKPRHAGPNNLHVYAYDAIGNRSDRKEYLFYVPPRDIADGPGDTGGDGIPDLLLVDSTGNLRTYAGDVDGEMNWWLAASYADDRTLNPPGHWYDPATGRAALITKHSDTYPGDGATDLFVRTPDDGFWLYPGDGYGSFNTDRRLRVLLPGNSPAPSTWTQIKAVGDLTGDGRPELVLRAGTQFWALTGYTGASFQEATLMEGTAWARRQIVNVADVDLDGTPDLLWRELDTGRMFVRHGRPGPTAGSVDLNSLKTAAASRQGDVQYGNSWTEANVSMVIGIPDVNGDRVPDLWTRSGADGRINVYHASTTDTGGPVKVVLEGDWSSVRAFG
ncbi:DNRLRE domain-containing protein [Plantactinospora sp. WMMC1484]|uniref:DNRLRE domain-containing protein n=1 Tax=Plantactinospora sp. WMMC1484 TaxID=3404122 RepID=UPI003BF474A6